MKINFMASKISSVISGTGSYIPKRKVPNSYFSDRTFLTPNGETFDKSTQEIIDKLEEITGIKERRYVSDDLMASDIGTKAAENAIESADIDPETIDYIIAAHNFGDIRADNKKVDMLPSLASRIKQNLGIKNHSCVAYDLPFGCPGWVQGIIQGHYYIQSGDVQRVLVVGTETLSRICDPHDRDSMIFSDGAGATILEARETDKQKGILSHSTRTDTEREAYYLTMGPSYNPDRDDTLYIKMQGRRLYQYALSNVPGTVKDSIDQAGIALDDVKKVLIHQANAKMDQAIMKALFKLYDRNDMPEDLVPMTISWLGNSSVATIPTLLDLIQRGKMNGHHLDEGDAFIMASVGAGMNINSVVYRM